MTAHRPSPAALQPAPARSSDAVFWGYRRNGRAGTRNCIGVMASVSCSATVAHVVADRAHRTLLPSYPEVDALVPLIHAGLDAVDLGPSGYRVFSRTLRGFLAHPNFAGVLLIGLAGEMTRWDDLTRGLAGDRFRRLDVQHAGGTLHAIDQGMAHAEALLKAASRNRRQVLPTSELVLGLRGDDLSGPAAGSAIRRTIDRLVAEGGTVLVSGTREIRSGARLDGIVDYAATVDGRGLILMDTLDPDPGPMTGQVAGGANILLSATDGFGCQPAPDLTLTADLGPSWGPDEIFGAILAAASGRKTMGEGLGRNDSASWPLAAATWVGRAQRSIS